MNDDPQQQPQQTAQSGDSNGLGVAALVIGILSAVIALIPIFGFISWLLAPLAIILGLIGMQKESGRGLALGGVISGGVGLVICVLWLLAFQGMISWGEQVGREFEEQIRAEQAERDAAAAAKQQSE